MSTTKKYIGNLQRRIANQRTEIEHLRSVNERRETEIKQLCQRIDEIENGYEQTLYLERLKNRDLTEKSIVPPCNVGDKVAVRAMCECVITMPCYEECRHICPFENDCECEECSSLNERIFDTTVSSIFNNGQGWYIEFKNLIPFARFADIGTSFFIGENAHEQAVAYNKGLAERSENNG